MLRLGLDGRALRHPVAGIGRYVLGILSGIAAHRPVEVVVYLPREVPLDLPRGISCRVVTDPGFPRGVPWTLWMRERVAAWFARDGVEVFWACSMALPRRPGRVAQVLSVYDVVHRIAPASMTWGGRLVNGCCFADDLRRADATVAISCGTRDRVLALYGHRADAIALPDADPAFRPVEAAVARATAARYGLPERHLLMVGTHEPRKNLDRVVEAMRRLGPDALPVAVVGRPGWGRDALAAGIPPGLRILGYVPGDDLPGLMAAAEGLLFPTSYEGFGMPALEAARCGTPVLAADQPELREAAGAALVPIGISVDGLVEALRRAAARPLERVAPRPMAGWSASGAAFLDAVELARERTRARITSG